MNHFKSFFTSSLIVLIAIASNSCDPIEVADIVITYEVIITNSDRPYNVTYSNATNGEDAFFELTDLVFTESVVIPSDTEPLDYFLYVDSEIDQVNNTSQSITLRIFEDDELIEQVTSAGTAFVDESVSAYLPTGVKYN